MGTRHVVVVDNSALAKAVGERIRVLRTRAGLTQLQLAGGRYTAAYISALERGLAKPSLASMVYLAYQLNVRIVDLLDDGERAGRSMRERLAAALQEASNLPEYNLSQRMQTVHGGPSDASYLDAADMILGTEAWSS